MPNDVIPLLVAASRFEFGDDDFMRHYRLETYVLETISAKNYPTDDGQDYKRMSERYACPEIDRAIQRIVALRLAGKIEIYAEKCDEPGGLLKATPDDLWRLNDVTIALEPPHQIWRAYDRHGDLYGPSTAEWRNPRVIWSKTERHLSGNPPRGVGRPSRRAEIHAAYHALDEGNEIDFKKPQMRVIRAIRQWITGSPEVSDGLGDETIRNIIAPLFEAAKSSRKL